MGSDSPLTSGTSGSSTDPIAAVHEFDISGLPHRAPALVATVRVSGPDLGGSTWARDVAAVEATQAT